MLRWCQVSELAKLSNSGTSHLHPEWSDSQEDLNKGDLNWVFKGDLNWVFKGHLNWVFMNWVFKGDLNWVVNSEFCEWNQYF